MKSVPEIQTTPPTLAGAPTPVPGIVPWLVASAFFMQMLDGTIVNIALPSMARDLGVDALRMQSVVIAYLLTAALFIPLSGWLADKVGTRRVFFAAIVLFTTGSALCAAANSLTFLVAARIVQGLGGALMVPVGRLTILKSYPRTDLVRVLSFVTIPGMLGPLFGPVAGGFLVEYASWHWIFLINIPVGLAGCLLTLRYLPSLKEAGTGRFDLAGFIIFGASMVLLSFAMEGFGEMHMPKVQAIALSAMGLALMCVYWLRCGRMKNALFSTRLFHIRSFSVGIFGNIFSRLGAGAMPFMTPLFLQLVLGYSPFKAGMFMMPTAMAAIAAKRAITPLVKRVGFRRLLSVNTVLLALLIACFSLVGRDISHGWLLALLTVFGAVNATQFTAMNSLALIDLPEHDAASGNSLLSVTMQISASAGVATAAALIDGFGAALAESEGMLTVFHYSYIAVGLITLASAGIYLQTPKDTGKDVPARDAETPQDI